MSAAHAQRFAIERDRKKRDAAKSAAQQVDRLRSLPYSEYLKTRHWRETRARALRKWKGLCEECGVSPATEVHHKTYERLGCERPTDLAPLCSSCHSEAHATD